MILVIQIALGVFLGWLLIRNHRCIFKFILRIKSSVVDGVKGIFAAILVLALSVVLIPIQTAKWLSKYAVGFYLVFMLVLAGITYLLPEDYIGPFIGIIAALSLLLVVLAVFKDIFEYIRSKVYKK
jgi:hypothetical protein